MDIAIYLPIFGVFAVLTGAVVARATARDIASLNARQKAHDVELTTLNTYGDALLDAANAVQSYVWFSSEAVLQNDTLTADEWREAQPLVDRSTLALEKLRFLGRSLHWDEIADAHTDVISMLDNVTRVTQDDVVGRLAWNQAVNEQPDPITRAHDAVAQLRMTMLSTYPVTVPDSLGDRTWRALLPDSLADRPWGAV